jgi:DNA-binding NarL/FixJ family response regulator
VARRASNNSVAHKRAGVLLVGHAPLAQERLEQIIASQKDLRLSGAAQDRPRALRMLVETNPDLMITELMLGDAPAWGLIEDALALRHQLKMLVISASEMTSYAERTMRAGAHGFIVKPCSATILPAMRRVLGGKLYLSHDLVHRFAWRFLAPSAPAPSRLDQLSDQELNVFTMIGLGIDTRGISDKLHVAPDTIRTYRARIKEKLHLQGSDSLPASRHPVAEAAGPDARLSRISAVKQGVPRA